MFRDQVEEKAVSCLLLLELECSSEAVVPSLQPVYSRGVCRYSQKLGSSCVPSRGPCQASQGLF